MPLLAAILVALLLTATPAAAWNEPDGFRDVPWGSSEETIKSTLPAGCEWFSEGLADRVCSANLYVGEIATTVQLALKADKLVAVFLHFKAKHFLAMQRIFTERYGEGTSIQADDVKTKLGVSYTNLKLRWVGKKTEIELIRYLGNVTDSFAAITVAGWKKDADRRLEDQGREQTKKGAGDL